MSDEFDRYAIERQVKVYSNDLLSATHGGIGDMQNAIDRAQSLISDWEYLQKVIDRLKDDVKDAQRRSALLTGKQGSKP